MRRRRGGLEDDGEKRGRLGVLWRDGRVRGPRRSGRSGWESEHSGITERRFRAILPPASNRAPASLLISPPMCPRPPRQSLTWTPHHPHRRLACPAVSRPADAAFEIFHIRVLLCDVPPRAATLDRT